MLFKLHWGGRGVKGEAWRRLVEEDFRPRLERMWREADYLRPRALIGYFPCYSEGNEIVVLDPEDRATVLERLVAPRQPNGDRICLADFFRPRDSGELDVVALQAVTAGNEVTELMARLEREGEFAEQLFTHGLGVQTAEGMAEWLHWRARRDLGIPETQGRRYSWGYPAIPEQSEHEKVYRLLGATERIGLRLSGGYAVEPEQSTLALIAHHPEAIYFGTTSGRLLPDGHRGRAVAALAARALVARPAVVANLRGRVRDAIELLPGQPADVADVGVGRAGAKREAKRVAEAVGDDPASVLVARARVVAQRVARVRVDASSAPLRPVGSPVVRASWLRSAPPSAVGGVMFPPTGAGSPQGFVGEPPCP